MSGKINFAPRQRHGGSDPPSLFPFFPVAFDFHPEDRLGTRMLTSPDPDVFSTQMVGAASEHISVFAPKLIKKSKFLSGTFLQLSVLVFQILRADNYTDLS